MEALPATDLMHKWWAQMADIMETAPDSQPFALGLECVFHMP